jgi:hypothetical protein
MNTNLHMRCAERTYRGFFSKRRNWKKWVRAWRSSKSAVILLRKGCYIQQADGHIKFIGKTRPEIKNHEHVHESLA